MALLSLLARVALAAVFGSAALGKLRAGTGVRQSALDLGLPSPIARLAGVALVPIELSIAAGVVPATSARLAGSAAAALLVIFTAILARSLILGEAPSCHCFGQASDQPIDGRSIIRNIGLLAVSLLVAVQPAPSVLRWGSGHLAWSEAATAVVLVLTAVVALQGFALVRLTRRTNPEATPNRTVRPAVRAPTFRLPTPSGNKVTLRSLLLVRHPVLLVFVSPNCGPCRALLPELADWARAYEGQLTTAVVTTGSAHEARELQAAYGFKVLLVQRGFEVGTRYKLGGTPAGALIDRDGRIEATATSGADIRLLVNGFAASVPAPTERVVHPRSVGDDAPGLVLLDVDGRRHELGAHVGTLVVMAFWRPGGPRSEDTLRFLRRWEAQSEVALVVIAVSSAAHARRLTFQSPVLVDDGGLAMRAFGAVEAPAAVFLDARLRVAAPVATTYEDIVSLCTRAADLARMRRPVPDLSSTSSS